MLSCILVHGVTMLFFILILGIVHQNYFSGQKFKRLLSICG